MEQVEILLLVNSDEARAWTVREVYDVILSSEGSVTRWLERLSKEDLIVEEEGNPKRYRAAVDAKLKEGIAALRHAYRTLPTRLIEAIYRRDVDALQGFADAFKLKEPRSE